MKAWRGHEMHSRKGSEHVAAPAHRDDRPSLRSSSSSTLSSCETQGPRAPSLQLLFFSFGRLSRLSELFAILAGRQGDGRVQMSKKSVDEIWAELNKRPVSRTAKSSVIQGIPGLSNHSTASDRPAKTDAPGTASSADARPTPASVMVAQLHKEVQLVQQRAEAMDIDKDGQTLVSNWDPARAGSSAEERDVWTAQHQRDINCMADPNKHVRARAVQRMSREVAGPPAMQPGLLQAIVCGPLLAPLVRMLDDVAESCRETALELLAGALATVPEPSALLPAVLPALHRRMGRSPVVEPTEEIRVAALRLVGRQVCTRCRDEAGAFGAEIVGIVSCGVEDAFPESKKEACAAIGPLCDVLGMDGVQTHQERLLACLAGACSHQHARVRQAAVEAMVPVAGVGMDEERVRDALAPPMRALAWDHSPPVRQALFRSLGVLLGARGSQAPSAALPAFYRELLPLLLLGVTDESPEIASEALSIVEEVGTTFCARRAAEGAAGTEPSAGGAEAAGAAHTPAEVAAAQLPAPYRGLPRREAGEMVGALLPDVLGPVVKGLREWTVALRSGAARALHTMVAVAGDRVVPHLDQMVAALCGAVLDKEHSVARLALAAVHVIGALIASQRWLGLVLDEVTSLKGTPQSRTGALTVLAALLLSAANAGRSLHAGASVQITAALTSEGVRGCDTPGARVQVVEAVAGTVRLAGSACAPQARELFLVLLQMAGTDVADRAVTAMGQLAEACGHASAEDLAAAHAPALLDEVTASHVKWTVAHPDLSAFQSLLRACPAPTLSSLLPRLSDLGSRLLAPERDPQMRLSVLRLLDELMEDPVRGPAFRGPLSGLFLMAVLLPPCVWRAGKVAAAVRYAAAVSVGTMLERDLIAREQLVEALAVGADPSDPKKKGALIAVVTSLMDEDYYTDTRLAAVHVCRHLIRIVGPALMYEQRRHLYPELAKRLDDASDVVREAGARTIQAFVAESGKELDETNTGYLVKSILIHMDDANAAVAEAVCAAVCTAAGIWPAAVRREVEEVMDRFRSKVMCERVIRVCQEAC